MTEMPYCEYDSALADGVCWVETVDMLESRCSEIARDPRTINATWCRIISMTEDGKPLHSSYDIELAHEENCQQKAMHKAHGDLKPLKNGSKSANYSGKSLAALMMIPTLDMRWNGSNSKLLEGKSVRWWPSKARHSATNR